MEITFEQRSGALFASLRRDNPRAATPAERAAHDRVWNGLVRFCEAGKIGLSIPAAAGEHCSEQFAGQAPGQDTQDTQDPQDGAGAAMRRAEGQGGAGRFAGQAPSQDTRDTQDTQDGAGGRFAQGELPANGTRFAQGELPANGTCFAQGSCHVLGVVGVPGVLARPPANEIPCGRSAGSRRQITTNH